MKSNDKHVLGNMCKIFKERNTSIQIDFTKLKFLERSWILRQNAGKLAILWYFSSRMCVPWLRAIRFDFHARNRRYVFLDRRHFIYILLPIYRGKAVAGNAIPRSGTRVEFCSPPDICIPARSSPTAQCRGAAGIRQPDNAVWEASRLEM